MKTCMVCHILLRRTTADRGQALPRRSGAPGRHRPGGRGADRYHEVGGSRLECRERVCEADDQKAPLKTTSPPLPPAAVSPALPMIARQWLFMHFWWHWDSNCPPSRRSSSFQRCSKPRWIHDVPVKDVPHNAIWPARTAAGGLDHREDALARRDRGHEHSVLHIQQLQAASDGAARVPRWSIRLRNYGATIVCVM